MSDRPTWDQTFSEIARVWSRRSTCSRRQVGAVVVKENRVIGQGYNGVPTGERHCIDGGCPRGLLQGVAPGSDYNLHPCKSIHAEHNAILQAGFAACRGAVIYTTEEPCYQCATLINHVGIIEVRKA